MTRYNVLTGHFENDLPCETLRLYGLSRCHPQSCDECPNYVPTQPEGEGGGNEGFSRGR